jgi:hypothetical protein
MERLLHAIMEENTLDETMQDAFRIAYNDFQAFLRGDIHGRYSELLPYIKKLNQEQIDEAWLSVDYDAIATDPDPVPAILFALMQVLDEIVEDTVFLSLLKKLGLSKKFLVDSDYSSLDIIDVMKVVDTVSRNAKLYGKKIRFIMDYLYTVYHNQDVLSNEDLDHIWEIYVHTASFRNLKSKQVEAYIERLRRMSKIV